MRTKTSWNETALMESWRRSAQSGLLPDSTDRLYPLDGPQTESLRNRYQTEIRSFNACAAGRQLPRHVSFLLIDANGVLLEKTPDRMAFQAIRPGFCFAEANAGTNAVGLALLRHEPVWTCLEQNYASVLASFSLYSLPLAPSLSSVCLALISTGQPSPEWPMALLDLFYFRTAERLRSPDLGGDADIKLTKRQREVLLYIARGMKNQDIASRLYISVDDVKYHRGKLYERLDAGNSVTAVIHALEYGCITLNEIRSFNLHNT